MRTHGRISHPIRFKMGVNHVKNSDILLLAKSGADSVFRYVELTAEEVSSGVRWKTYTHQDKAQYGADLYNGVAGITLFLSDYYHITRLERARDMAWRALKWCESQPKLRNDLEGVSEYGLGGGWAGISLAWLRYGEATGDRVALEKASQLGETISKAQLSPYSGLMAGNAGIGTYLLRLAKFTGNTRFLEGAIKVGQWFEKTAIRESGLCYWPPPTKDPSDVFYLGLGPGLAGNGYLLLKLFEATGDTCWRILCREVADTLCNLAIPHEGGYHWPLYLGDKDQTTLRNQWCLGASGIGLFFAKAYELLEEPSYLEKAKAAGETTFACGDARKHPCQCHGLAGNADLFLELHRITRDTLWLDRAHDYIRRIFKYRIASPEGDLWQSDRPYQYSPEFMNGAAGVGHFFLRFSYPNQISMPLF